jgi:hypothetical protein
MQRAPRTKGIAATTAFFRRGTRFPLKPLKNVCVI